MTGMFLVGDMQRLVGFRAGKVLERVNGSSSWKNVLLLLFFCFQLWYFQLSVLLTPPVLKTSFL